MQQPLYPCLHGWEAALPSLAPSGATEGSRHRAKREGGTRFPLSSGPERSLLGGQLWQERTAVTHRAVSSLPSSEGWGGSERFPALGDFCNPPKIIQDKTDLK